MSVSYINEFRPDKILTFDDYNYKIIRKLGFDNVTTVHKF